MPPHKYATAATHPHLCAVPPHSLPVLNAVLPFSFRLPSAYFFVRRPSGHTVYVAGLRPVAVVRAPVSSNTSPVQACVSPH